MDITSTKRQTVALPVYVGPDKEPLVDAAVLRAGGVLSSLEDAEAVVWTRSDPATWQALPPTSRVRWVQLLIAGVERWLDSATMDDRLWVCARGASDLPVAEHALALLLGVQRRFVECARSDSWRRMEGVTLHGATVLIVGAGAVGSAIIPALKSFGANVVAVTRSGSSVAGANSCHSSSDLHLLWPMADAVVLAAPATQETHHLIDREALNLLPPHAVIVNVARGALIDTDALVEALRDGRIGGAGLDVTEPEPLPDDHPLWRMPNVLITPHVANPDIDWKPNVARRVEENIRRYRARQPLLGVIDRHRGY